MTLITGRRTFSSSGTIYASDHEYNDGTIWSDYNGNITNANISGSAAISYSKLSLTGGIVNADISSSAAIVGSKLDLSSPGAIGAISPAAGTFTTLKVGTTNQGDILYDNGTSITRLTPGTSGQFLKTQGNAANPTWADQGLSFVSNTVISAASNSGDIAITNTNHYLIRFTFNKISTDSVTLQIRINNDTGTNYQYSVNGASVTTGATSIIITPSMNGSDSTNDRTDGEIRLFAQASSNGQLPFNGTYTYPLDADGNQVDGRFTGRWAGGSAATSFRILVSSGNITGNVYLYKYATS